MLHEEPNFVYYNSEVKTSIVDMHEEIDCVL